MELKQFKLTSGEEIICEIMEWPDAESESADMVVRNILNIVAYEQTGGNRYYTFKPWMVFQDAEDNYQILNINHVVGECNPSEKIIEQYFIAIKGESSPESETAKAEIQKQLEDYINKLRGMVSNRDPNDSDNPTNIVSFPGRTIH